MNIIVHAMGMPFNGQTLADGKSLGGSETAAYYLAKELAARGHRVLAFTASQETGIWDNVRYEWMGRVDEQNPLGDRFHYAAKTPHDVVIVQRHPLAFQRPVNAKLKFWWLHDLALQRNMGGVIQTLPFIDRILTVSDFHTKQVADVYGVPEDQVFSIRNGVDYEMIKAAIGDDEKPREGKSLFFGARPERGLMELVAPGGIMEHMPDYHLYVAGYDNTTPQMADMYNFLWQRCNSLPNVTLLGPLGKAELYKAMSKCKAYIYPTLFKDTSCIMALEANACGLPFIGPKHAALPETIGGAGSVLVDVQGGYDARAFIRAVKKVCENDAIYYDLKKKAMSKHQDWKQVAETVDNLCVSVFAERSQGPRLVRHLEQMSDIVALTKYANGDKSKLPKDFEKNYRFFLEDDYREHYRAYYQYEKSRGVNYGPEDLTGNPRFETIFQIIVEAVKRNNAAGNNSPIRILDYGCAHGHYVMNILNRLPDCQITGVDIEQTNIDKANEWAKLLEGKCNPPTFICGTTKDIPDFHKYDIVIAAEVLEHVPDVANVVDGLRVALQPDGFMIISTPYGPWEAIGYEEHKGWRAHIHHFEREDLFELFGGFPNYRVLAVPHSDDLGHFVCTFGNDNSLNIGEINYERKLRQQAPRETMTACIIARDAEYTIGKCLTRIAPLCDEIIVGIDENTKDNTKAICERFGAKTFTIVSPIKQGFDSARNETIERATMDWIMWIDDDETFEMGENLDKWLRPNGFDGYAVAQHHHAVQPAALFKTDFPVRIFRNGKGIRFFGFVHEHPETELNKGPGRSMIIPDVSIMHTGYSTENIRRKRFHRNFPLMQIERQKYPTRILGRFLWMRDLAHLIRYEHERTGRISSKQREMAQEIHEIWRALIKEGHTRLVVEGIQYYSEATAILGPGLEFCIDLDASPMGGGAALGKHGVRGLFINGEDILRLSHHLTETKINVFANEYF